MKNTISNGSNWATSEVTLNDFEINSADQEETVINSIFGGYFVSAWGEVKYEVTDVSSYGVSSSYPPAKKEGVISTTTAWNSDVHLSGNVIV